MLRFEEIDDKYCNQYIEMLQEWKASNTSLTPDILEIPCNNETEYRNIVRTAKMQPLEYTKIETGMKNATII